MTDDIKFRGLIIGMFQNCKGEKPKETDEKQKPDEVVFDMDFVQLIIGNNYEDWLAVKKQVNDMVKPVQKQEGKPETSDHDTIMKMSTT